MTVAGQPTTNYFYDDANRLTQITQGLSTVAFTYDGAGRRTSLTLPNGVVVEYSYDTASRLTELKYKKDPDVPGNLTYFYDKAGNRTRVGGSFARTGLPQAVASATYDNANRQTVFGGKTMAFDLNGNLTSLTESGSTTVHTWNARNQLTAMSGPGVSANFVYDGLGRREKKTIGGNLTEFLYDGVNPVQETSGATILANILTGLGIDEPFSRTDVQAGNTSHLLSDALGSVIAATDLSGTVQTEYTYEPFGKTTISGVSDSNPFQYTGRENDGTGLYSYRARYYHPTLQRFISEDPLELSEILLLKQAEPSEDYTNVLYSTARLDPRPLNSFAYVANNPTNDTDPTGEIVPQLVACGLGAGVSIGLDLFAGRKINWRDAGIGCITGALGLRVLAGLSRFPAFRFLNQNPYLRIGPGRFFGESNVPSVRIGPSPWNQGRWWTHWRLYP